MSERKYPFIPRAKTIGVEWILCPACGYITRFQLNRFTWRITCGAAECRKIWGLGRVLLDFHSRSNAGTKQIPPLDITFPIADIGAWNNGERIHRIK